MNVIGLIIFVLLLIFVIKFAFTLLSHLFQVFGWLGTDLTKIVAKVFDVEMAAPKERPRVRLPEAEDTDDELAVVVPRRRASHAQREDEPLPEIPEQDEEEGEVSLLLLFMYTIVFIFAGITSFFITLLKLPRYVMPALRMPYPLRCSIWYFEIFMCIMPIVIFSRVPDIYGYQPTINAAYWGLFSYPCFIFVIYLMRIIVPVDIESLFRTPEQPAEAAQDVPDVVRYRHMIYGVVILTVSVLLIYRLALAGLLAICFLYSLMYFLVFRKRGNPNFSLKKFIMSWIVFCFFAFIGIAAVHISGIGETVIGFAIPVLILITLLFVHTLWVMSRKFNLGNGVKEIPLMEVGSWMNQFISPLAKLAVAVPMFYFIILFFSIRTNMFYLFFLIVAAALIARWKLKDKLPAFVPGGLFSGYVILVWVAIFFIQTFNRIPPTSETCARTDSTQHLRPVYTADSYNKVNYLSGTLPYDASIDPAENALFVTFKNLNGYGAVVRLDPASGEPSAHIITENDNFPGEMFYPERLCIDTSRKKLFSTTKSNKNFQLLEMDYSEGLTLSDRMHFGEFETTNCTVDDRDGKIYTIFLGPPNNHFRIVDPNSEEEPAVISFGRFGYADYFQLDQKRDRLVVPSLDPANRFSTYTVKGLRDGDYRVVKKKTPLEFTLFGGFKIATPVPTLGIAYNPKSDSLFFSCPFIRLVFEIDAETFRYKRRVRTGRFPREIAVNEKLGALMVANYGDGVVEVFDLDTMKRRDKLFVGKLVRSITVEKNTGRTFIVTGCGVFEYTP